MVGAAQLDAGRKRMRAAGRARVGQLVLVVPTILVVERFAAAEHGSARGDERGGTAAHPAGRDGQGAQVAGGSVAADQRDPGRTDARVQDDYAGVKREPGAGRKREQLRVEHVVQLAQAAGAQRARASRRLAARSGEHPRRVALVAGGAVAVKDDGSRCAVDELRGGEMQLLLIDVCVWYKGAWARVRGARTPPHACPFTG
ncbi:hypothetical protein FGB62_43g011 [Gracilaria domingensis]|nr:hypothetical protein FGB62_43g011 [Gracilaria domingensis]